MRRRQNPEHLVLSVGRRVRELRRARGLTQEALAEKLGAVTPHVQAIERGVRNLTLFTLARLADALDVEIIQLFVPPLATDEAAKPGRPSKARSGERGPVPIAVYVREVDGTRNERTPARLNPSPSKTRARRR